ncbi:MAG: alpha/beta hydrolase [Pseudomonadota bacterium]|nr:MAG: alpha/beta hydrolase [Pseudomonadota bacterium]
MNSLWFIVLVAIGGYVLVLLVLYLLQARLLYLPGIPGREITATPAAIGLRHEDVELLTEDGVRLHGWFVPGRDARGVVLFFHGNAGNISHRLDSLRIFHQLGYSSFIIDYRGYGLSEGRPTEQGTYRDADAAWRYLVEQRGEAPHGIVVFGRSLGAAVAAYLAGAEKPRALIVETAFTSVPDLAAELYPMFPVRPLSRFRYDTRARLAGVSCPVLIVHSADDEIIPFSHGRSLFEAAREPKQMLVIRGGHNEGFIVSGNVYLDGLASFLRRLE